MIDFRAIAVAVALTLAAPFAAQAVQPDEVLPDPKLEQRARDLSTGLRCLVCQNQSIYDSDAPLAKDLRILVRDRLKAGDTDQQARDFIVSRYGDFVLLKPPFKTETLILWVTPAIVLAAAVAFALVKARGQKAARPAEALSAEERAALEKLAGGGKDA